MLGAEGGYCVGDPPKKGSSDLGDPAMALAVPVTQYRSEYLFHAPTNYTENYVNVVAPSGTVVDLDGVMLTDFEPIGASGYDLLRVRLADLPGGNHSITGDGPFGISVYGYAPATSYWYPGGLNLEAILE